jgi:hypothetical protein
MYEFLLNLHTFDGEGGGASAGAAGAGDAGGESSQAAAGDNGANGLFAGPDNSTDATSVQVPSFEDYVSQHKDEANKWFQERFNQRFKDYKTIKSQMKATDSILDMLATKYGIEDTHDVNAITQALQQDDYLYAERAEANGRTIEEQRNWDMLERENRKFRQEQLNAQRSQQIQRQMEEWENQSNNLKQIFPDFNLDQELTNPDFETALRSGLSIERAFYAVHGQDILTGAMQDTAKAVRQATAEDMAARRSSRPRESAIGGQASAKVQKDVHKLSRQERAEIARQSMLGNVRFN